MAKKELDLIGQTLKTVREYYKATYGQFNMDIAAIRPELERMAGRPNFRNLKPEMVKLIKKHMEGEE